MAAGPLGSRGPFRSPPVQAKGTHAVSRRPHSPRPRRPARVPSRRARPEERALDHVGDELGVDPARRGRRPARRPSLRPHAQAGRRGRPRSGGRRRLAAPGTGAGAVVRAADVRRRSRPDGLAARRAQQPPARVASEPSERGHAHGAAPGTLRRPRRRDRPHRRDLRDRDGRTRPRRAPRALPDRSERPRPLADQARGGAGEPDVVPPRGQQPASARPGWDALLPRRHARASGGRACVDAGPVAGGLRLVSEVYTAKPDTAPHEARYALIDRGGRLVRSWRVRSRTAINFNYATPELVGGDPVVVLDVTAGTNRTRKWEYLVLRLGANGVRTRFSLSRAVFGDNLLADVRIGPDGNLYQLASSPTAGVTIGRFSLGR